MPEPDTPRLTLVIATGHALSLALLAGKDVLAQSHDELERGHAEALMPAIERLLEPWGGRDAPIGEIIVETGPGSFTGLRVGLAAARALALAWGVPLAGVRSTELVRAAARADGASGPLLVALAAPRGQVWSEAFDGDGASLGEPVARTPDAARAALGHGQAVAGSAAGLLGAGRGDAPRASAFRWLHAGGRGSARLLYVRQQES